MTDAARDYRETLFLPKTDFPMRAGLPQKEPEILKRWAEIGLYQPPARGGQGPAEIRPARRPALCQRQHPYRPRAQQDPEGRGDAQPADARATIRTTCRAGTATACRSNGRSRRSTAPRARTRTRCRSTSSASECRAFAAALDRRAARGVQAARRRGRLGASLHHHGLRRRGADRARADEVRGERQALSRLEAGDVVGGREDRARRSRGRVRGLRPAIRSG